MRLIHLWKLFSAACRMRLSLCGLYRVRVGFLLLLLAASSNATFVAWSDKTSSPWLSQSSEHFVISYHQDQQAYGV